MYTATFIFAKGDWDAEFHALDATIAEAARALPGYLGEESWDNAERGLVSNVYYWESLEALQALMQHPAHLEAKRQQARWLQGYQVHVAQVLRSYGDGRLAPPGAACPVHHPQAGD
ncbi:antibiotic biosynthesis monooxygenase family protein [Pelomonas sp. BJYL3]|uniref:antibiotic biosynthesis monooxygenase family protein n=1 Tax=Pelomonas sp. BJYL3 TaxID=2976697 RepID=UPI0022B58A5B|nr:antibiotic biosynthesis monooxygenase [Pelomonas sp. BJYL3]